MATAAKIGYGTTVELWDPDAGPAAYVTLAEVINVTPPPVNTDRIDATNMQSPNRTREYIAGMTDPGECVVTMNHISGSASHQLIIARMAAGDNQNVRITDPYGSVMVFLASVVGYEPDMPVDDKMTATLTLQMSGDIEWTFS